MNFLHSASTSSFVIIAEITAAEVAPALITWSMFSRLIPPIATNGIFTAFLTSSISFIPEAGPASGFVFVSNIGLTPM